MVRGRQASLGLRVAEAIVGSKESGIQCGVDFDCQAVLLYYPLLNCNAGELDHAYHSLPEMQIVHRPTVLYCLHS